MPAVTVTEADTRVDAIFVDGQPFGPPVDDRWSGFPGLEQMFRKHRDLVFVMHAHDW